MTRNNSNKCSQSKKAKLSRYFSFNWSFASFLFFKGKKLFSLKDRQQNYFVSWISNFGVVPLFTFCLFLFEPLFLVLLARRVFVTLVRETIISLSLLKLLKLIRVFNYLKYLFFKGNKGSFLPNKAYLVKKIFLTLGKERVFFQLATGCMVLLFLSLGGHSLTLHSLGAAEKTLVMAKGEQKEIYAPHLEKFSFGGSRDILSYKFQTKKSLLLIKGKKLGYSDLILWKKNNKKEKWHLFIISKQHQLKLMHLQTSLNSLSLKTEVEGMHLRVSGVIQRMEDYQLLRKLSLKYSDMMVINAQLSRRLRNKIIGEIYHPLWQEYVEDLSCSKGWPHLLCSYDQSTPPSAQTVKYLQTHFAVIFQALASQKQNQNFRLKLKLVQMENLKGREISFGLDQLSGSLGEIFTHRGLTDIIMRNNFFLRQQEIEISTLAQPETILRMGEVAQLSLGTEIPVSSLIFTGTLNSKSPSTATDSKDSKNSNSDSSQRNNNQLVQWKFAGLKVKVKIKGRGQQYLMTYETEFTRPSGDNVSGNKGSSSLLLSLNQPVQIFQIGYLTREEDISSFPGLSSIPILGAIFQARGNHQVFKKIFAVLVLEKI